MAFVVIDAVRAQPDTVPGIIADVHRLGLDVLRFQSGFRSARLLVAEDESEVKLIVEWASRDDFNAFRESEAGRQVIEGAGPLHPHINFYVVVGALDRPIASQSP
jgi:heme-degrading monooxygenase HmoA